MVEQKERLSIHGIDPAVGGGGAQTKLLARHLLAWQLDLMAVVYPRMAIDVQYRCLVGMRSHPLRAQLGAPGVGLLLIGKQGEFLAQGQIS